VTCHRWQYWFLPVRSLIQHFHIVTCRSIARKRVDKHFSADWFLQTNSLWNTFPWIRVINKQFLGYRYATYDADSIGFWRWCITHKINEVSDFVHRPDSKKLEDKNTGLRLPLSKGPNRVSVSPHLRTERDPVSETSCFYLIIIENPDDRRSPKTH
jgi:hypothetical protein